MGRFDDYDDELKQLENNEIKVKFTINLKKMDVLIARIVEETREFDAKHPRAELMKIWAMALLCIFGLLIVSRNIVLVVTLPFLFFYVLVIFQIGAAFKRFRYKRFPYWMKSLGVFLLALALALCIQALIWK